MTRHGVGLTNHAKRRRPNYSRTRRLVRRSLAREGEAQSMPLIRPFSPLMDTNKRVQSGSRMIDRGWRSANGVAIATGFGHCTGMKCIIAVVLILVGAWLLYSGYRQADSLAGRSRTAITDLKNSIDGKSRVARQYWYYGAGILLIGTGVAVGLRRQA